ncbi:single-stranded DNA-binding protein [Acinetobacter sp. FL51]|nr:single-stranded DNA-binding protein [Acinetobacter sp. FL51]
MPNVHKVIVMSVLGRDPETKNFPNGGSVTIFSVITSEHWKDTMAKLLYDLKLRFFIIDLVLLKSYQSY